MPKKPYLCLLAMLQNIHVILRQNTTLTISQGFFFLDVNNNVSYHGHYNRYKS